MTNTLRSLLFVLIAFATTSGIAVADEIPQGDYTLVKVTSRDGKVHPDLIQVHPARVTQIDGRLVVEVHMYSMMRFTLQLFHGDRGQVVFFLTPDSSENLVGSAAGEIYRGHWDGEGSIRGSFHDGGSIAGSFALVKSATVEKASPSAQK